MPTVRAATCFECFHAVGAPPCGGRESSERSARKTTNPRPCSASAKRKGGRRRPPSAPCPAGLQAAEEHHGDRQDRRRCKKADGGSREGRLGRQPRGRGFHVDARVIVEFPRSTRSCELGSEVIMKQKNSGGAGTKVKALPAGQARRGPAAA